MGSSWRPAGEKQIPFSLFPVAEVTSQSPEEQFQSQQQVQEEVISALTPGRLHVCHPGKVENFALARCLSDFSLALVPTSEPGNTETEPTEPGPLGKYCHGLESWGEVGYGTVGAERAKPWALQVVVEQTTDLPYFRSF